ncbi:MAG: ABC transporter permease [Chloroflexota bacterium]|nr:ABC transporter permease [Chloroflexota bacterium]MDE2958894.1 ABC transporter permease [Chloroflexota bacterium]
MNTYVIKRFMLFIPTLLLVTLMVFALMRLVPGDPAELLLMGFEGDGQYSQQQLDELRAKLGTDRPLAIQYLSWIWGMLRGDFGMSMYFDTPISDDLAAKLPITLELSALALLLAFVVAIPLGVLSAVRQDTIADYASRIIAIAGVAMPTFWIGILVVYFLVTWFDWLPPLGYANLWSDPWTNLQQMFFPAVALGFYNMALVARVTRSSMLEVFREDYIRTARSKGLREGAVIIRHALKNAFLPILTISGWQVGRLIAGTVVIETIFLVPGMGRLLVDSILHRDYTMIQSIVMVIAFMVLALNLVVDLLYAWLDPRIRYE